MAYVKLDTRILDSTLWIDREAREVFVTALLMAEPREFPEPIPQISVRTLELTGWSAPPGWYGWIPAAGVGIVRRAGTEQDSGLDALERLGNPEPDSRNPAHEGRRLIRADGGYLVLNYMRYRDYDHSAVERQRRLRARRNVTRDTVTVTPSHAVTSRIADADADADADAKGRADEDKRQTRATRADTRLPDEFDLSDERRAYAVAENLDADRTFAQFSDYWRSVGGSRGLKRNWDAAWRYWCRNQVTRSNGNGGSKYPPFVAPD